MVPETFQSYLTWVSNLASQGEFVTWSWNRPETGSREKSEIDLGKSPIGRPCDLRTSWTETAGLEWGKLVAEIGIEIVGFVEERVMRRMRGRIGR